MHIQCNRNNPALQNMACCSASLVEELPDSVHLIAAAGPLLAHNPRAGSVGFRGRGHRGVAVKRMKGEYRLHLLLGSTPV
ncbi:hypothetical protein N431DRAFT_246475 [Stipitochalara longipes BDJ]|nr:hypothetical protein N431DRAFT_246475 [Stipitochalara longipes BDJ]